MGKRDTYPSKTPDDPAALAEIDGFVSRVRAQQAAARASQTTETPKAPEPAKRTRKSTRAGD